MSGNYHAIIVNNMRSLNQQQIDDFNNKLCTTIGWQQIYNSDNAWTFTTPNHTSSNGADNFRTQIETDMQSARRTANINHKINFTMQMLQGEIQNLSY